MRREIPQSNRENGRGFSLSLKARVESYCAVPAGTPRERRHDQRGFWLWLLLTFFTWRPCLFRARETTCMISVPGGQGGQWNLLIAMIPRVKYVGAFPLIVSIHLRSRGQRGQVDKQEHNSFLNLLCSGLNKKKKRSKMLGFIKPSDYELEASYCVGLCRWTD